MNIFKNFFGKNENNHDSSQEFFEMELYSENLLPETQILFDLKLKMNKLNTAIQEIDYILERMNNIANHRFHTKDSFNCIYFDQVFHEFIPELIVRESKNNRSKALFAAETWDLILQDSFVEALIEKLYQTKQKLKIEFKKAEHEYIDFLPSTLMNSDKRPKDSPEN